MLLDKTEKIYILTSIKPGDKISDPLSYFCQASAEALFFISQLLWR